MGNSVPSSLVSGGADFESHWNDLPRGTKLLLHKYHAQLDFMNLIQSTKDAPNHRSRPTDEVVFSSPGRTVRDGLDVVLNFVIMSSQLADREYTWNLQQTLKSACIIAADYLFARNDRSALLMIFYIALIKEYLARGPDAVLGCWVVKHHGRSNRAGMNIEEVQDTSTDIMRLGDEIFFSDLSHLHHAVVCTRSRKGMASFLSEMLAKHSNTYRWVRRMEEVAKTNDAPTSIHSFNTSGAVPEALVTVRVGSKTDSSFIEMQVYKDTTLKWIFDYVLLLTNGSNVLKGASKVGLKLSPALCLWNLANCSVFHLATYGDKTLHELQVEDGDAFLLLHTTEEVKKTSLKGGVNPKFNSRSASSKNRDKKESTDSKMRGKIRLLSLSKLACCSAPIY